MERSLVVRRDSRRKCLNIKVLTIFVTLAGLALVLWPAPEARGCLGRNGEIPPFGGSKPNPKMAARLRDAQALRNLNGINMPGMPPIRGNHPTVFILIESTTATLPWWNPTQIAAPFNTRFRDPALWVNLRGELDNYYNEVSRGILRVIPAKETFGTINDGIIGPVSVPDMQTSVSQNSSMGTGLYDLLASEAIIAANPYINFGAFDINMDGQLDSDELHIVIFQAGFEFSANPNSPTPNAWAHMMPGPPAYTIPLFDSDNIIISSYLYLGSEILPPNAPAEMTHVGTIAHEFGHDLGLPDLYDTDGAGSGGNWGGLGWHSLMAGGAWGDDGKKPVHIDGFLKSYLFWGQETDVMAPTNQAFSLPATMGSNNLVRVNVPGSAEFFIIENRQHYGFDAGLPGTLGGLAIYHCDGNRIQNTYLNQYINVSPMDPGVQIMQADGSNSIVIGPGLSLWGSENDYFRLGNNTVFNRLTNPHTLLKNGLPSGVEISDISATGPVMTFTLNHGNVFSFPVLTMTVREEQGQANVVVNLDRPAENQATVQYAAVAGGTATPLSPANPIDWDFHLPSGTLTFEPGATSKYFPILLNNDAIVDPGETINLLLRNPQGAILNTAMSTMTLTIQDNDKVWLNLISPNGGAADNKMRGSICPVRWNFLPAIGPEVRIDLFKDNAYYITLPGAYHVANDGYTTVTLSSDLPVSYKYRMAVTAVADESFTDQSDDYFAILDPNLKVLSVTINGGISPVSSRKVSLDIKVPQGLQFGEYMASESSSFAGAAWLPFNASTPFTLSVGDGFKRVWLKIRNSGGQESAPVYGVTVLREIPAKPVIEPIPDRVIFEHQAYTGPAPKLLDGNLPPINWALVNGPAGMTINPQTGVVSWKDPRREDSPAPVSIRATNPAGSGSMAWQLDVQTGDVGRAVDWPQWTWSSSGDAGWYYQTGLTHDGLDAARTRPLGHNQKAVLSAAVNGPGVLGFWWYVSSEANFDKLSFKVGATTVKEISGSPGWAYVTTTVPAGPATLSWTYAKDSAGSAGQDTACVDQLTWQAGLQVTSLSRTGYVVDSVGSGKRVYGDATVVFGTPAPVVLQGQTMIRTLDKDHDYSGSGMLGFYVDRPVQLILALDSRFATLPGWAAGFAKLPLALQTSAATMTLYAKDYPAGKIVLGGTSDNHNPNSYKMYSVILIPAAPAAVSGISNTGYVTTLVKAGWGLMIDSPAVFSAPISALYEGATAIRTRKTDAGRTGAAFLSFVVGQPVTVLVGFDSVRSAPPAWAAGWQYYGERIAATDGQRKLYGKRFAPGRIVLGANVDPGETNVYKMYSVIVLPNN